MFKKIKVQIWWCLLFITILLFIINGALARVWTPYGDIDMKTQLNILNVRNENIIGNLTLNKGSLHFDNPTRNGTIRLRQHDDDHLHVERFEVGTWVLRDVLGGSIQTNQLFVNILSNPGLYIMDTDNISRDVIIKKKLIDDGIAVGNSKGDTIIISKDNILERVNVAEVEDSLFAIRNETIQNIKNITYFYTTPSFGVGLPFDSALNFNTSFLLDRNYTGLIYARYFDLNKSSINPIYESADFFDFTQGTRDFGVQSSQNITTLIFNPTLGIESNVPLRVELFFSELVNLTGGRYSDQPNVTGGGNIINQFIPFTIGGGVLQKTRTLVSSPSKSDFSMGNFTIEEIESLNFSDDFGGIHALLLSKDRDTYGVAVNQSFLFVKPLSNITGGNILFGVVNSQQWHMAIIEGLNNSANSFDRSGMFYDMSSVGLNATKAVSCLEMYDANNWTPRSFCDTDGVGSDILGTGIGGFRRGLFVGGSEDGLSSFTRLEGPLTVLLKGNDANFINGSIHSSFPINFDSGFTPGEEVKIIDVEFNIDITPFSNQQSDIGNWIPTTSGLCDDNDCALATGAGAGNIIMKVNFNTVNINDTTLTFIYSLVGLPGSDTFTVDIDNGSGFVELLTDTGTETELSSTISLDEGYWNKTSINLTFTCGVTGGKPLRQCYVDSVVLNGSAMVNTIVNINGFNSEICFGDGSRGTDGNCTRGIFYDAQSDTILFRGTTNITGSGSGVTGSGSANSITKWASSSSLTDSSITDDGSTVSLTGDLSVSNDLSIESDLVVSGNANISDILFIGETKDPNVQALSIVKNISGSGEVVHFIANITQPLDSTLTALYFETRTNPKSTLLNETYLSWENLISIDNVSINAQVQGVRSINLIGGTSDELGFASYAGFFQSNSFSSKSYGIYTQANGRNPSHVAPTCYSIYADSNNRCTTDWSGYFVGNVYMGGNVGIGTENPTKSLTIESSFPDGLMLSNLGSGNYTMTMSGSTLVFNDGGDIARVSFNGTGAVGIGTASPDTKLEVSQNSGGAGGTSNPAVISIGDTDSGSSWDEVNPFAVLEFRSDDSSGDVGGRHRIGAIMDSSIGSTSRLGFFSSPGAGFAEQMTLLSNGDVGIGTVNPFSVLHINVSGSGAHFYLEDASGGVDEKIKIIESDTDRLNFGHIDDDNTGYAVDAFFGQSGDASLIKGKGLWIQGDSQDEGGSTLILNDAASANGVWRFTATRTGTQNRLEIGEGSDTYFSILSDTGAGNVGIGTNSPGQKLEVVGTIESSGASAGMILNPTDNGNAGLVFQDSGTNEWELRRTDSGNFFSIIESGVAEIVKIQSGARAFSLNLNSVEVAVNDGGADQNFRVETTQSPSSLFVDGGTGAVRMPDLNTGGTENSNICAVFSTGELLLESDDVCTLSSIRYKDDVQDMSYGLDDIMKLRPVTYRYKKEYKGNFQLRRTGFIAEEMALVIPEVVTYEQYDTKTGLTKFGVVDGIDYAKFTAVNTKAIQELKLEKDLEFQEMKIENNMLKNELCNVNNNIYSWCEIPQYYSCLSKSISSATCPGGISGGLGTRCYIIEWGKSPWTYCSEGWVLLS